MHEAATGNPALAIALALAAGVAAQITARHARAPGIVLLLAVGVLLGPDGAGLIIPGSLGPALEILTGFAVSVILFEGGMNLHFRRIRAQAGVIRRLISMGLLTTMLAGAAGAKLLMGWDWRTSILFGSLVTVTGPTVITPLLRRIRVRRDVETLLEAEGVFIDGVGAIVAVVTLETAIGGADTLHEAASIPLRLLAGLALGAVGGLLLAGALRSRRLVPERFRNILVLSWVMALFQLSNYLVPETGIVAAIIAGLVVGNIRTPLRQELREFKEELTLLLIGMLFVLLAADVGIGDVLALGAPGLLLAVVLMFLIRPLAVAVSTAGSDLDLRGRIFLSWLAPRGIVAAAVASLFADRMSAAELAGGEELRAEVFLVIAVTVVVLGSTAGPVSRLLGLRRPSGMGYAILGAHPLGRALAGLLGEGGVETVLIDSNVAACREAEAEGFRVVNGNALEDRAMLGARVESRRAVLSTLPNEAVGMLFARKATAEHGAPAAAVAIQRGAGAIGADEMRESGFGVLFGAPVDIELWDVRIRRKTAAASWWRFTGEEVRFDPDPELLRGAIPLVLSDGGTNRPFDDGVRLREGILACWLVFSEPGADRGDLLRKRGWVPDAAEIPGSDG